MPIFVEEEVSARIRSCYASPLIFGRHPLSRASGKRTPREGGSPESFLNKMVIFGFVVLALLVAVQSAVSAHAVNGVGSSNLVSKAAASVQVSFSDHIRSDRHGHHEIALVRVSGFPRESDGHAYRVAVGHADGTFTETASVPYVSGQTIMDLPLAEPVRTEQVVSVTVTATHD